MHSFFLDPTNYSPGYGLQQYLEQFIYCCRVIAGEKVLPQESPERKKILCTYLGLRSLEWDNRDSFGMLGYNWHQLSDCFTEAISCVQSIVLQMWHLDA